MTDSPNLKTIAILGGTGKEGKGLAYKLAKAGYRIFIGSRSSEKAGTTAHEVIELLNGKGHVEGTTNHDAAQKGDVVVLTVPYSAHRETLENVKVSLRGKILIDVTVPLVSPRVAQVQMPPAGSAAQEAVEILGETAQVSSAFQNISHEYLLSDEPIECDVLVTGTSREARAETLQLVSAIGLTGWDAGPIGNSAVVEGLTSILIGINKQYGLTSAGIKITGKEK
jgi:NADPH-dependent F420 reductase